MEDQLRSVCLMSAMTSHPQKFTAGSVWCVCVALMPATALDSTWKKCACESTRNPPPTKQISESIAAQKLAHICARLSFYFFIHARKKRALSNAANAKYFFYIGLVYENESECIEGCLHLRLSINICSARGILV